MAPGEIAPGAPVLEVVADAAALAAEGARRIGAEARAAVAARGRFVLALSGGRTPAAMFEALAAADLPWRDVHLFQVDERVAPDGHPDRNLTGLRSALVDRVPIPPANVHPMPVTEADLEAAASGYTAALHGAAPGGMLDLVHLGLGDDGHTASWPPGDPVVDVTDRDVAVVGPYRGRVRLTLTPPAVNRARRILWLVDGADKAGALRGLLDGDPSLPASRVRRDEAVVLATAACVRPRPSTLSR
ncbi:MAG TPA: 6-phosphogluconolactonase [Acidimicrobiia bacterium]|nr:6-phosphogluconolactonase [Acidimicrobiia bacterium]